MERARSSSNASRPFRSEPVRQSRMSHLPKPSQPRRVGIAEMVERGLGLQRWLRSRWHMVLAGSIFNALCARSRICHGSSLAADK